MILSIHQPSYFPWLGLLDKISKSDKFVLLDDVQVVKGTYQYRNIFFCNGQAKYLTLPITYSLGVDFKSLEFKDDKWRENHLNTLRNYYLKSPYFKHVFEDLKELFANWEGKKPIDVLKESMEFAFSKLQINVEFTKSSSLTYEGKKGDMVLSINQQMRSDKYIAGSGSYDYMQAIVPKFKEEEIELIWHKFNHPVYKQHPKFDFVSGLSVLDLFFFHGYEEAQNIFWNNQE